jgi:hypothetical protein
VPKSYKYIAIAGVIALSACSGSDFSQSVLPQSSSRSPQLVTLQPQPVQPPTGPTDPGGCGDASTNSGCETGGGSSGGGGAVGGGGGDGAAQVACVGTPSSCSGRPCSGSPDTIGEILPDSNTNAHPADDVVTDENYLVGPNGVTESWLYEGSSGATWIQFNYSEEGSWSVSFSKYFASFGFTPMGATSGVVPFTNSSQFPSTSVMIKKCETQGGSFNPPIGAGGGSWG